MNLRLDRRADAFSAWLEARLAGTSTPDGELTADPDLRNLCGAADRFHGLSETWAQDPTAYSPSVTSWEDLMTRSSQALPQHASFRADHVRAGVAPGRWETWNRFASGVLIAALVIAIGAGAWRIAGDRDFGGGTEPAATNGAFGLAPTNDSSAMATPESTPESEQSGKVVTPVEQLPGIESAVLRHYSSPPPAQPPSIPNLIDIGVSVYRFDSPDNAAASYDLLVANVPEVPSVQSRNSEYTRVTADISDLGERGTLVRLDFVDDVGYQSEEYVLTLHDRYVFAVVTVTGGPYAAGATPPATADPSPTAVGLATELIADGQPSRDKTTFYQDGTSTGGDWGYMPAEGEPLLMGLVPRMDQVLYPVPER